MAAKKNTVTYNGTGRRKTSVARVFMTPGSGNISVNGKTLDEYLPLETLRMVVRSPLELTETLGQFDIKITFKVEVIQVRLVQCVTVSHVL